MAILIVEGIETLAESINKIKPTPAEIKLMVQSGVDAFIPVQKRVGESTVHMTKEGVKTGHILTGNMIRSIAETFESEGVAYVYPQGSDSSREGRHSPRHPVRNATKAFIANYGRERQAATGWVEHSRKEGEKPTVQAMTTKFNEILKTKGLI